MEILILLLFGLLVSVVMLPFVAMAKANATKRAINDLAARVSSLENEMRTLQARAVPPMETQRVTEQPVAAKTPTVPPPLPVTTPVPPPAKPLEPPPIPQMPRAPARAKPVLTPRPPIDWEQFMGAKLFAWIGGLALFLGIAFFVKYSFEHNLIPPELRVAIGFAVGVALLIGGVLLKRKENAVTAQTLCATGILVLYAVTFACRSYYHFAFFGLVQTFALMVLITAIAFVLAVRLNAMVIAVLGLAGGFLTPVLLSTGQDNPLGLFVYIALLDIGLLAIACRQRWNTLALLGAIGTILMQSAWVTTFFVPEKYFAGNKVLIAMVVFAGFEGLFLGASVLITRIRQTNREFLASAVALGAVAILFAFYLLSFQTITQRPALLFGYLFIVDLGLLSLIFLERHLVALGGLVGVAVFVFLGAWTTHELTTAHLYTALAFYFVFALFHTATPLVLQRLRGVAMPWWSHAFPAFALLLVLISIFQLTQLSIAVWPFILIVDLLAIALALASGTLLPIVAVLLLTLVALGALIARIPAELSGLPTALFLLGGFAIFFLIAPTFASRRFLTAHGTTRTPNLFGNINDPVNLAVQLPALSATPPFLLLIMVVLRLPLTNPSPVFMLALLLVVLLLGMSVIFSLDALVAIALVSVLALEHAWHLQHFDVTRGTLSLLWYLGFYAVFTSFPFLFHRKLACKSAPWITAALAGPLHFYLIYDVVRVAYPNGYLGLIPAALGLPSVLALSIVLKRTPLASPARETQIALFGGATLFFITLIFPIQFEREWITMGWALEGAALCWLFRRVPHPGLRITGTALLCVAFVRLALNPAVLTYHSRAPVPIWNWYLYTYGIATVCLLIAARLLAPPRHLVLEVNAPRLLYALGTVLAFLLVNIEIADYFSIPGAAALTFEFSGNFARDMSYSVAWALFALFLLIIGMRKRSAAVRYASLTLLGVTVAKLFLHDLSQLEQLYRIGAFLIVAVIAILASFLYQRFLAAAANQ
jgi:hypothetical protein